ncbi:hypothetical protein M569_12483 [Genlisea aurea]|uniref:Avr9/Cf-9 rapidly elicited protein 146 n=1 Tax=Genlisea aurea TaxID=192259 RepID=S8C6B9_9LAMI|nr:hypothetical protein M569_12483 [Genlisea aurea]
MGQKLATIISKKLWKMIRVSYMVLRKGITKARLLSDLTLMMKRAKLAGKSAVHNLVDDGDREYEFSCSDTPPKHYYPFHFLAHRRNQNQNNIDGDALAAAMELASSSVAASPAWMLPGFGRTPAVRQLRVSDSPFPEMEMEADDHVDEAAEEYILRFYRDLKLQNSM